MNPTRRQARFVPLFVVILFTVTLVPATQAQDRIEPLGVGGLMPPNSPGVGTFQVIAVQSGLCLGYRLGGGARLPYLALGKCGPQFDQRGADHNSGWSPLIVVPYQPGPNNFGSGFTLRSPSPYDARGLNPITLGVLPRPVTNREQSCVTIARDVITGPPGIDIRPCNAPASGQWQDAGGDDQVFFFVEEPPLTRRFPNRNFRICRYFGTINHCLDVRGASSDLNTDLILWPQNNGQNQVFHFSPIKSWMKQFETSMIRQIGYLPQSSGPDVYWYARPIFGWDLVGNDGGPGISQSNFETDGNDIVGSGACTTACIDNPDCAAFTWVRPTAEGGRGRCWLKGNVPAEAIANPNTASGVVRHHYSSRR